MVHQTAFLEAYELCGTITGAADAANVARRQHFEWIQKDPTYFERFEEAGGRYVDRLVAAAVRRGVGVEIPVFDRAGAVIGHKFEASDSLLAMLIKRNDRYYSERFTQEISVSRRDEYDAKAMHQLISTQEGRDLVRQMAALEERMSELMKADDVKHND